MAANEVSGRGRRKSTVEPADLPVLSERFCRPNATPADGRGVHRSGRCSERRFGASAGLARAPLRCPSQHTLRGYKGLARGGSRPPLRPPIGANLLINMTDLDEYDLGGVICTPAEASESDKKGAAERRLGAASVLPARQLGGTGATDGGAEETAEGQVAEQASADTAVALRLWPLVARDRGAGPPGGAGRPVGCGLAEAPAEVAGLAARAVRGTVPGARRGGGRGQLASARLRRDDGEGARSERLAVAHPLQRAPAVADMRLLQGDEDARGRARARR